MAFDRKAWMKEYHKKWYLDNKEKLQKRMKENHQNNLDRDRERSDQWYINNKELVLERQKERYRKPEEKLRRRQIELQSTYGISFGLLKDDPILALRVAEYLNNEL